MNHADLRLALGAYVLGALEPSEHAEVAAHLEDCAACRSELTDLAPMPGLLGRLTADEARTTAEESVPAAALEGALAVVAARRRVRRRRWASLAAAVAVAIAIGVGLSLGQGDPGRGDLTISATDAGTHVSATAKLRTTASGTSIALTMRGVPAEARCRLVVVDRSGHREVAGSWRASYAGGVSFDGATAISRPALARLEVVTFGGRRLVTIPVT